VESAKYESQCSCSAKYPDCTHAQHILFSVVYYPKHFNCTHICFCNLQIIPQIKMTDGCSRGAGVLGKYMFSWYFKCGPSTKRDISGTLMSYMIGLASCNTMKIPIVWTCSTFFC